MKTFDIILFNLESKSDLAKFTELKTKALDKKKKLAAYTTHLMKTKSYEERGADGEVTKSSIQEQWVRCEIIKTQTPADKLKSF